MTAERYNIGDRGADRTSLIPTGFYIFRKLPAEDPVAVPKQVTRDLLKGKGLPELLRGPLGRRMGGDVEMDDPPSVVSQNQEHIQDLKPDRRHGEEVHRDHGFDVILKERPPVLRWWVPPVYDVLAHACLADIDAEFQQLAVDTWGTPKWILAAHLPNQLAGFFRHCWTSGPTAANFPCPEQPEALTMPANDGFRPDDDQGRSPIAPDFAQPSPEEPIGGCQFRPPHRATQDAELVPKCQGFQLKGGSRFEGYRRGSGQHVKRAEHRAEELMKDAQTPCSHSIRCLRYPQPAERRRRAGWPSRLADFTRRPAQPKLG